MTNRAGGTLYIGVTSNLARRIDEHRRGAGSAFCHRYGLDRLVHVERFERIGDAIAREKALKGWNRAGKLNLIGSANSDWRDLWDDINA